MPCYEVRTVSVSFQVGNIDLLKNAIEENAVNDFQRNSIQISADKTNVFFRDRYSNPIKINLTTGKMTANMDDKQLSDLSNSIKRAYSKCVIDEVAKKQHWLKKKMGPNQFQLQRF